jgi:hypothetical protein
MARFIAASCAVALNHVTLVNDGGNHKQGTAEDQSSSREYYFSARAISII